MYSHSPKMKNLLKVYPQAILDFLKQFSECYSAEKIIEMMESLRKLKVLVIGETIIDEYHYVDRLAKPMKGDHISGRFVKEEVFAGGILACANHLAGFCDHVDLITVVNKDDTRKEFISSHLKPNIDLKLFYSEAPTIVKRRFVSSAYLGKLFEVQYMDDRPSSVMEKKISGFLSEVISKYDLVFVLDYGHGLMTKKLVDLVCDQSKFLAVNVQANSANFGYNLITKYPSGNYFCLDDHEIRLAFQGKHDDTHDLVKRLADSVKSLKGIILTLGHLGALAYDVKKQKFFEVPALSYKVIDAMGAGDAFISITSPCMAVGMPMDLVSFIGNAAGAVKVGIVGNKSSVEPNYLYKFISTLLK